jgi:multisubunit Na+/H+ antiporter MnhE subunit
MAKQNPGGDAGRDDVRQQAQVTQVTGPLAGEPRHRRPPGAEPRPRRHRVASWLTWWVLLMSLWVAVDDSLESDELLAGASVTAAAALLAELIGDQADVRLRIRAAWLPRALRLPGQVVSQTWLVFAALARTLFTKAPPPRGRFRERPVGYGDETPLGVTRRVLLTGATSLAPNEFVLGFDAERGVMITHQLVEER